MDVLDNTTTDFWTLTYSYENLLVERGDLEVGRKSSQLRRTTVSNDMEFILS